jgi:ABC-2 type transport system permease protein
MRAALAIAKKELSVAFTTPVAWVMFTVLALFAALFFNFYLDAYRFLTVRALQVQQQSILDSMNVTDVVVTRLFGSMGFLILVVAPFLSMRLVADEKRAKTFELLLSSPVRPVEIVLGKYAAALALVALCVGVVALFPLVLSLFAKGAQGGAGVEWQTVGTGLLGLFLLGAMAMAVGLFVSSLTDSVVVAALVSLVVLLALSFITGLAVGVEGPVKELVNALSASEHLTGFLAGRIELKDVVYYLSFVVLGLWLTERTIEGHRWSSGS